MRLAIITASDGALPFANLSRDSWNEYAARHGYDFFSGAFVAENATDGHPSWQKLAFIRERIENYPTDFLLWVDTDTVVTNYARAIGIAPRMLAVSRDWSNEGKWSAGVMLMRVGQDMRDFVYQAERRRHFMRAGCWDQSAMQEVAEAIPRFGDQIEVLPRRVLQSVPRECSGGVVDPWQPGDFCAHATGIFQEDKFHILKACHERAVR